MSVANDDAVVVRRGRHRAPVRRWRRRQVWAALLLALSSTAATVGWIALTLASYAWWGSPSSPLRALFWPAIAAFVVWAACRLAHAQLARARRTDSARRL